MSLYLRENLTYDAANITLESKEDAATGKKSLYMNGIFIQGDKRNANGRVYPVSEIRKAVKTLNEQIANGYSVLGEVDHPDDLKINLDRVSHMITEMWTDGPNGFGKLKIIETPMGNIVKTMLESGVKLGVSSRGSGNVNEATGDVSDFEIVTVDIVAQPSAPDAYPTAVYEGIMNMRQGHRIIEMAREAGQGNTVDRYLRNEIVRLIKELKIDK